MTHLVTCCILFFAGIVMVGPSFILLLFRVFYLSITSGLNVDPESRVASRVSHEAKGICSEAAYNNPDACGSNGGQLLGWRLV